MFGDSGIFFINHLFSESNIFYKILLIKVIEIKVFNIGINCKKGNLIITDENHHYDFCKNKQLISFSTSQKWIGIIKMGETNFSFRFKVKNENYTRKFTLPKIFNKYTSDKENTVQYKNNEISPLPKNCGIQFVTPTLRIIGGKLAKPHSWPWQVYLSDGQNSCGASLLNNKVTFVVLVKGQKN